jgi:hypothetical protein
MPQFILDHGTQDAGERYAACDAFTRGYIEAAFWLAKDENDQDESGNPNEHPDWSVADLSEDAWKQIHEDCDDFQKACAVYLRRAYEHPSVAYDESNAGVDFLLTRNHHGAGFWDRGLEGTGKDLTEMAHPYGSTDLYEGDDGKLYLE